MLAHKRNHTLYAFIAMTLFIALEIPAIFYHELWLDEANTFLALRDTNGWKEFYSVFGYEGHPWLWAVIVKGLVILGGNFQTMQFIHMLFIAISIYFLWKYSPFKVWEKLTISSGYFFLYEYSLISRDYALGLMLLLMSLVLFQNKKYVGATLIACFCFQTHLHFFLLSFLLVAHFLWMQRREMGRMNISLICFLILLATFLLYMQIKDSGQHGYFQYAGFTAFSFASIQRSFIMPLRAFFPLSDPIHFSRDGHLIFLLPKALIVIPAVIAICYPFILLKRNRMSVTYYGFALVSVLAMSCITYQPAIQMRHCGTLWVGFLVAFWLLRMQDTKTAYKPLHAFERVGYALFSISLFLHIYASVLALYMDARYPFSDGKNTAAWIKENANSELIFCAHHFSGPPIAVYLDRQLYYPEIKTTGTYCLWNTNPFMVTTTELHRQIEEFAVQHSKPFILILNDKNELPPDNISYEVQPVVSFDQSIVRSENFYIYRVTPQ